MTFNFDYIEPWKSIERVNLSDDGEILARFGDNDYRDDGSNGQVMVRIPKFYYRAEHGPRTHGYYISPNRLSGYKVSRAHLRNGKVVDEVFVGAYEGCAYDVSAGAYLLNDEAGVDFDADMLSSIAGAKPMSGANNNLNIANARRLANNRGPGWGLLDFHTVSMIQMLLLVEYATFNSQLVIGAGITNITDDGSTNMGMPTGQTADLGNASGSATGNIHPVTGQPANSVSYRGIENLWGNIWQFVDGINIRDHRVWIADHGFQSDLFGPPYEDSGYTLPNANGYVRDIRAGNPDLDHAFLPSELGGSASSGLCDYYYQSSGNRIALLGGGWDDGSRAGAWYWSVHGSAASVHRTFGARLLYVGGE